MAKALGDEIMVLEGLGNASMSVTKGDLLNAVTDFPINVNEQILSGLNENEDSLNDVVSLSDLLSELGRIPRRRRPRYRPRRSYPYPVPYYPGYPAVVEPTIIVAKEEEEADDDNNDESMKGLGYHPHHRGHRHGGRYRPIPYPYYYPTSVEPSVLVVEKEDEEDSDDLEAIYSTFSTRIPKKKKKKGAIARHIRRLELKMKDLHPSKVKLTAKGVEGFGTLTPAKQSFSNSTKVSYQIAMIQRAAQHPNSPEAKTIIRNLDKKSRELETLSKNRLQLAGDSIGQYRKDKDFVNKLERVARSKAMVVVNSAANRESGRAVERKMDREIKDVRRLHDRSVGIGRRAVHNMKVYAFSSMLSKNADAQAMVTKAAKFAVMNGKPEEAKILALAMNKHAEIAKAMKATRQNQTELWKSESNKLKFDRLTGRRERFLKAIALLEQKSKQGPLSEEDRRAMRDAYAQVYRIEAALIGLQGGVRVVPQDIRPKQYTPAAVTLEEFHQSPNFSVEVQPNDPSGVFLQDIGMIFNTKFSVEPTQYNVDASIGAIFEPRFTIGAKTLPVEASLEAMFEPRFTAKAKTLPVEASIEAMFEPSFTVAPKPLDVVSSIDGMIVPKFTAQMVQPPVEASFGYVKEPTFSLRASKPKPEHIGRWLENFALGWFSDAGDLVDDTQTSLADMLKGINGWDDPIDCEVCKIGADGLGAGPIDLVKKIQAQRSETYGQFAKGRKTEDVLDERTQGIISMCGDSARSCETCPSKWPKNPPWQKHGKKAYQAAGNVGKWVVKGKDGKEHLDPTFIKNNGMWCEIQPKGKQDRIYAVRLIRSGPRKGRWVTRWREFGRRRGGDILSKIGKAVLSPAKAVGKVVSSAVKSTLKATEKVAKGAVNVVKTVASTSFNTLKEIATGDLKGAAKALYKGGKGVAGEVYRQAKGVYDYAKSQFNAVCGLVSDSTIKTVGAAAAGAVTGGAGAVPAAMAIQYGSKVCGAASGVGKMAKELYHGDFKDAAKALVKTGKGLTNVKDMISSAASMVGVPIPPAAISALGNTKSIAEAGKVLSKVASGKNVAKVLNEAVKSNISNLVKLPPNVKKVLAESGSGKDVVSAIQKTKDASALALIGKAPSSPYYKQILSKSEKQAVSTAVAEARKAMGFSGDIYDIAEAMDRRNLMQRKSQVSDDWNARRRRILAARKRMALMARKMSEGQQWERGGRARVNAWDGLPEKWVTYKPVRYVSSSIEEVPYVEPPYRRINPYRRIAVTKGFGQLPGNFPQLYDPIIFSKKHGLGEVKYVEPKYRRFTIVRPRSYITSSIESLFSGIEGVALGAPVLLT